MKLRSLTAACVLLTLPLAACSLTESNDDKSAGGPIEVSSSAEECEVGADSAESGTVSFEVKNTGDEVTEFYLYGEDGLRIIGEVENIGPGLTRDLVLTAQPGSYFTACKPGMIGKGIRSEFTVTDSGEDTEITGVDQEAIDTALDQYASYVKDQASQLVELNQQFVDAYKAGDDDEARELFPVSRTPWEGIETVAESFGDLDPAMDLRERDLEPGQKWTGWHRIEKDLWPPASGYTPLTEAQRATFADDLIANTNTLNDRVANPEKCANVERTSIVCTVDQISNGSKGLLDEVATGKITGEEDIWSHTDLWDFQANVTGAKVAYETLKPLLEVKDPELSTEIGTRFDALQALLDQYKQGEGFVFYDTVTEPQRRELSAAVDALAEPLSRMTGALTL